MYTQSLHASVGKVVAMQHRWLIKYERNSPMGETIYDRPKGHVFMSTFNDQSMSIG